MTRYAWLIDGAGDCPRPYLTDFSADELAQVDGVTRRLMLARYVDLDEDGWNFDESYADTIRTGLCWELADNFSDGATVPVRFRRELRRSPLGPIGYIREHQPCPNINGGEL